MTGDDAPGTVHVRGEMCTMNCRGRDQLESENDTDCSWNESQVVILR